MLVLGMIFAVVVACVAEVGAISNRLAMRRAPKEPRLKNGWQQCTAE